MDNRRKSFFFLSTLFLALSLLPLLSQSQENVFGTSRKNPFILEGSIYYLPEGTNKLPDFTSLNPVGKIYASTLNITPRYFSQGFPGVTDRFEWFAIRYRGKIFISKEGNYTFALLSDDGAKLIIDGSVIIDNDGVHPPSEKTGSVFLKKGIHEIEVQYFQGPRYQVALVLSVIEKGRKRVFDMREFAPVRMEEKDCVVNLTMTSAVLFDFDKYSLKPEARSVLNSVADFLKSYNYIKVIIEGHTDSIGSESYNLKLSEKRARSVAEYLIEKGIPASKIKTIGYGESRPKYPNDTEENRSKNRRVEIKVMKPCKEKN